jgi:hypothetical protein
MKISTEQSTLLSTTVGGLQNCLPNRMYRERGSESATVVVGDAVPVYDVINRIWINVMIFSKVTGVAQAKSVGWAYTDLEELPEGYSLTLTQTKGQ